jgi:hypothetical protein
VEIFNLLNWETWHLFNKNKTYTQKIFLARGIEGVSKNELFPRLSSHPVLPDIDFINQLNLTTIIDHADYVLVPHSWRHIKENSKYLAYLHNLARDTPLLMVNSGDVSPRCNLINTIELRTFLHPWEKSERKIILPYPVKEKKFRLRKWKPKPTVSFMGYVPKLGPGSLFGENFEGLRNPIKSSVYLNRKIATSKLKKLSPAFEVDLKIRTSFTAYTSNPNLESLVQEYESSLWNSDYILCPRGSGNTSTRFYESLSAGRTPILVDSGGSLPEIRTKNFWSTNVITINLFRDWTKKILDDWLELSNGDAYEVRQTENTKVFSEELKFEKYLNTLFQRYLLTAK